MDAGSPFYHDFGYLVDEGGFDSYQRIDGFNEVIFHIFDSFVDLFMLIFDLFNRKIDIMLFLFNEVGEPTLL